MAKKLLNLAVQTSDGEYNFRILADPAHLDHWRSVGLDIEPVCNTIKDWIPSWITAKQLAFLQDLFGFKNPWSKP